MPRREEEREAAPSLDEVRTSIRIPAFCPLCECVMKGSKSSSSYYSWGTCIGCFIEYVEGREDRWRSGWRPDREQVRAYRTDLHRHA